MQTAAKTVPNRIFSDMVLPKICWAVSYFPCPSRTLMVTLAPTPTMAPKAAERFIKGLATAIPLMAMSPTPQPTNMLSAMLNRLLATMAIMAGVAYCQSSRPIFFSPNSVGMYCCLFIFPKTFSGAKLGISGHNTK